MNKVPIVKVRMPEDRYWQKSPYEMTPEFLVIHNTANNATARNEIAYMIRSNQSTSFHYAVDEKEIVQGIELNRNGWHAGDGRNGKGNRKGIAIEIARSTSDLATFKQAEDNAAWLAAQLLVQFGWGINRVKKHQDFMAKRCPHRTLDLGWARFLRLVGAYMVKESEPEGVYTVKTGDTLSGIAKAVLGDANQYRFLASYNGIKNPDEIYLGQKIKYPASGEPIKTAPVPAPVPKPVFKEYMVKVTASALNYRRDPKVLPDNIVGTIRDKGSYTIVEEKNGWGKLKSGAGWIYLSYTQRIGA